MATHQDPRLHWKSEQAAFVEQGLQYSLALKLLFCCDSSSLFLAISAIVGMSATLNQRPKYVDMSPDISM
jgi:arginine exporter protein ArgO